MATRTMVEWRCERCGTEAAIEDGKPNSWCSMGGLRRHEHYKHSSFYQVRQNLPKIGGDLCPDCAVSLLKWWRLARATPEVAEVDQE